VTPYPGAAMTDEIAAVAPRLRTRVRLGLRRPGNWLELLRFAVVGASGYAVNLAVFTLSVHALELHFRTAAVLAFLVAVTNNFVLNRRWTFKVSHGHAGFQAARFLFVSLAAFVVNLAVLEALVNGAGMAEVPAQAIAIAVATPCNFLGNKLWSFAR